MSDGRRGVAEVLPRVGVLIGWPAPALVLPRIASAGPMAPGLAAAALGPRVKL